MAGRKGRHRKSRERYLSGRIKPEKHEAVSRITSDRRIALLELPSVTHRLDAAGDECPVAMGLAFRLFHTAEALA